MRGDHDSRPSATEWRLVSHDGPDAQLSLPTLTNGIPHPLLNPTPMRTALPLLAAFLFTGAMPLVEVGPPPDDDGYVFLFDGASLDGWKKVGGEAAYRIEGDSIVGELPEGGAKANTFLRTEKEYGDFVFKVDLKLDIPGNSGIQFRSHQKPEDDPKNPGRVYGYQMEVDPSDRKWSGGIYDEARSGWLYDLKDQPVKQAAFKLDGWNEYVIEAKGNRLRTWVNGVPVADLTDDKDAAGFIALQVHSGKEGRIRWKNIRIKELDASAETRE